MEAVRLSQPLDSRLDARAVYAFLVDGVDVETLDAPPAPVATGNSPEAVTSRSVLLNTPVQRVAGLDRAAVAALVSDRTCALGTLAQYTSEGLIAAIGRDRAAQLTKDLGRYGLSVGMSADTLRAWVLGEP